jgi:hypothetical protein
MSDSAFSRVGRIDMIGELAFKFRLKKWCCNGLFARDVSGSRCWTGVGDGIFGMKLVLMSRQLKLMSTTPFDWYLLICQQHATHVSASSCSN